jgi:hypothetical protein
MNALQQTFNYELVAGATFDETITWYIDDVLIPMVGNTARWQVRDTEDISPATPATPLWTAGSDTTPTLLVLTDVAPQFRLIIPAATTEDFAPGYYVHELEYSTPAGVVVKVCRGLFHVKAEITR